MPHPGAPIKRCSTLICELGVVRALVEVYFELVSYSGVDVFPTERVSHNRTVLGELCLYLVVLAG